MLKAKLKAIIEIVEASQVHEVEVSTWWGRKIRVTRTAGGGLQGSDSAAGGASVAESASAGERAAAGKGEQSVAAGPEAGHHRVLAPIVGTFYRAASPDAKSFVEVGDAVSEGQTICIIEAMKIMNEIESDASGNLLEVLVENASPVEFNQPLIVLDTG